MLKSKSVPTYNIHHFFHFDPGDAAILARIDANVVKLGAAMRLGFKDMAERINAVLAKFEQYRAAVEVFMTTVEAAKAEAIRADDAGEDSALANLVAAIDAAHAQIPTPPPPVEPPVEPPTE